jgi:hypothetical protein
LTKSFGRLIRFGIMGEDKADSESKRLLMRLRFPTSEPMVVEVGLTAEHLERVWKLMLICEKIKRTMHGRGKVIIEDASCHFISILSEAPIQRLLRMARVKEWCQLQSLWIPNDLPLGKLGHCRVMAGMRKSQTIVEEDSFWLRGHDGAHEFVSVALGRDWINRELARRTR